MMHERSYREPACLGLLLRLSDRTRQQQLSDEEEKEEEQEGWEEEDVEVQM